MSFLNIPIKSIEVEVSAAVGVESMGWKNPADYPVLPGNPAPALTPRDHRWRVNMTVVPQQHSSFMTRDPGMYTGMDINVGMWIANTSTGQAWKIIEVSSKTDEQVTAIVQDIFRYNTVRSTLGDGNGAPLVGLSVVFNLNEEGMPQIDPLPQTGVSITFTQNLQSRFEYINLQYDYPLYQANNDFQYGDVISVDSTAHGFVRSSPANKTVIGRVTSISDTIPGWFTINPVQKIVDTLDYLPGSVGDFIYASLSQPGEITTDSTGPQLYLKLRDNSQSLVSGTLPGPTPPGAVFQINGTSVIVGSDGTAEAVAAAINSVGVSTGVTATRILTPTTVATSFVLISNVYYEIALSVAVPAVATINGVSVSFAISSTTPGYEGYAQAAQMVESINAAQIPDIVASAPTAQSLVLTNQSGGPITIINVSPDENGVYFAGTNSGSGLVTGTGPSTNSVLVLTATDARPINLTNVSGSALEDFGLTSVENGTKAAGLYIQDGLRAATSTVLTTLPQLNSLTPLVGDSAYVINSDDGNGNNINEWSSWLYNGSDWVKTASQDSAATDAKSLEYTLLYDGLSEINIGKISTGRRVTLITVEVNEPFDGSSSLAIGFTTMNPSQPLVSVDGLMGSDVIDLTVAGTYTTSTDVLFGTDTPSGDVAITAKYMNQGSTTGSAQIIVSYV